MAFVHGRRRAGADPRELLLAGDGRVRSGMFQRGVEGMRSSEVAEMAAMRSCRAGT